MGWPRRSTVVNSVVTKRAKTCWTSGGSVAVMGAIQSRRPARRRSDAKLCGRLIVAAETVPAVQLDGLAGQLHQPLVGQPRQHRVERLLLADAGLERVVALESGGDPQRLAAVLAEAREGGQQEVLVRDRLPDLERGVPCREDGQVVVVELVDRLGG